LTLIAYIFVLAAVVSIVSVIYVLNVNIKKLDKNPEHFGEIQKQFMLGVAISKMPPSLIVVFGILKMPSDTPISALVIPWALIGLAVFYGLQYIGKKKKEPIKREAIAGKNVLITNSRPLLVTIPLMASAFLYLMTF